MFKRFLLVLSLLVAMPALANAWSVNAKAMTTGGTITPSGISTYGTLVVSAPFTVTAAAGKVIDKVKIDNVDTVAAPGTTTGVYTVNKGTASTHTILAFFKADAASVGATVNVTQPANGSISATYLVNGVKTPIPAAGIPVGATVVVKAMPATADYKVATITANSSDIQGAGPFSGGVAVTKTFTAVTGSNPVSATMEAAPVVRTAALTANKNTTTVNGTDLILDATGSVTVGTPAYVFNVADKVAGTDYNLVDLNPAVNGKKIFTPLTAGAFSVTVTVTSGNAKTSAPAFAISALTSLAVQNQVCTNCHNGRDPQLVEEYALSGHAAGLYGHSPIGCQDCHFPGSNEDHPGAINTANIISINTIPAVANKCAECHTGIHSLTTQVANFAKSSHANSTHMTGISCGSCHGGHQFRGATFEGATGDCQSCHRPGSPYGIYSSNGLIGGKHFNANIAAANNLANIASYVASATATNCSDCHGHNNVINAEYAKSGHGNMMGAAWEHYDFEWRTPAGKQDYVNGVLSSDCNRCHTTTGYNYFVASGFTTLSSAGVKPAVRETLYCNGCHTSAEGTLKTVGAFTGNYNYNSAKTGVIHLSKTFTDWSASNACVPCHSGRGSSEVAKAAFAFSSFTGSVTPFTLHHAQPAGLISGYGAYNFTSGDFSYQDRMRHMRIGVANYNGTGSTQGPCVGCHFTSEESHTLEAVSKDASGAYSGIITETCQKCHPTTFTYQDLNAKKAEFDAAVKVLGNLITSTGLSNNGRTAMKWFKNTETTEAQRTAAVAEKNMGAFINYNIVTDTDKALWLHNPALARRIVYDSIDWLDNSVMNSSAVATIAAQATAGAITATEKTNATSFTADPGCLGCHFGTGGIAEGEAVPGIEQAPHYNTNAATVPGQTFTQAQFVVPGTQCNNCHGFGHGTDSPGGTIISQYAESNHGSINGLAWTDYDFKTRTTCVMCHTTTGFVNAFGKPVTAGAANTQLAAWGDAADTTKQVLGCNACHSSTAWKTSVRTAAGGVTVPMGVASNSTTPSAVMTFADVGESNVCIPCHASRENGASLLAGNPTNATTKGFTNPHYLGAAAVFYGKGGFQFYTSGVRYNTYGAAGKTGKNANWSHGKLGMDNYSASGNNDLADKSNDTGNKGQCVACHLGTANTHTFDAADVANASMAGATNLVSGKPMTRTCYGCHKANEDNAVPTIQSFIEEEKEIWNRMFDFFKWQLAQFGINYTEAYPYFNNAFGNTVGTTFGGPGVVDNNKTRGAAMNLKLLIAEKGSHVHNRSFGRALIADSIVYLQKGDVGDRTVSSTDPNDIIKFSSYSTARPTSYPGQVGPDISISTLKSYLTRNTSGVYTRR